MAELQHVTSYDDSAELNVKREIYIQGNSKIETSGIDNEAFDDVMKLSEIPPQSNGPSQLTRRQDNTIVNDNEASQKDDDEEDADSDAFSQCTQAIQGAIFGFFTDHSQAVWGCVYLIILAGYFTYFGFAMYHRFGDEGSWRLAVCTCLGSIGLVVHLIKQHRKEQRRHRVDCSAHRETSKAALAFDRLVTKLRLPVVLPILFIIGFLIFIVIDIGLDHPKNLIGLGGLCFFIVAMFIFSHNPAKVRWRPVIWGIVLQVIFAILILRTSWGYDAFDWLGSRVTEFLRNTDAGAKFVFGDSYQMHFFAFKILPVVVFFSTIVSVLYHLGVMQGVIQRLGKFLSWCLGTTPAESINAAGNIFIGQTEAPLMIRPFLADMTMSELHAVMTGGFATVAGSIMATYIQYNVPANHLLSASVMSAPAALAIAKLFWPETEKPKNKGEGAFHMDKGTERNVIEAISNGASMSVKLVANIAVNLIAFVALLQFINSTLTWFGDRVGYDGLTFQLVCSYVFWPIAFLMGVDRRDCRAVAELIGIKTFLNELFAYVSLSDYINNRLTLDEYLNNATFNVTGNLTGLWTETEGDIYLVDTGVTLTRGLMSERSVVIATYALCGFSNLSSMGMQLGGLGALAPSRKSDMAKIVLRAMIAGNVACFMTACIAGIFYDSGV